MRREEERNDVYNNGDKREELESESESEDEEEEEEPLPPPPPTQQMHTDIEVCLSPQLVLMSSCYPNHGGFSLCSFLTRELRMCNERVGAISGKCGRSLARWAVNIMQMRYICGSRDSRFLAIFK